MSEEPDMLDDLHCHIDTLRSTPNEVGAAVCAIDHAEACTLPPPEPHLAGDLAQEVGAGVTERGWLAGHLRLAWQQASADAGHGEALNRLAQAVANLTDAGLWPW
jgi:hypothetical protein